jgi:SSS family solute:Na+ symporter
MHLLDWIIVASVFVILAVIALKTRRHVRGVSGFLAADRCAGRYLLTLADGVAMVGAINFIGVFQQNYKAGFGAFWWGSFLGPVLMFVSISGFIVYRFRETRAMTMAQFLEIRYSRRFRIFAGILAYIAGIINYGIFPAVTARFFIYFCDIPVYFLPVGPLQINLTLGAVMLIMLSVALMITFQGGQIAIMVTDFLQAQCVNIIFLLVVFFLFFKFGWDSSVEILKKAPEGQSMLNPFSQEDVPSFNLWFFVIMAFNQIYSWMAWQGNQGYNCSAKTPHDAKMAKVLAMWRFGVTWTVVGLIPICAYVFMNSPEFADQASEVIQAVEELPETGTDKQLLVPMVMRQVMPMGLFGLFVAAMLASAISTDDTCLHSWGSIFIQDIVMPFKKIKLEKEQHLKWLRRSILGVAAFVWCWSMLFPLQEYIFMYWAITGAIYVGGAGSAIIGGFYWKRATTAGAWAGMITGSFLATVGLSLVNVIWPFVLPGLKEQYADILWLQNLPEEFWLDGVQMMFMTALCSIGMFILFSLLSKPKPGFSMDKMLHRGKYAITGEHEERTKKKIGFWAKMAGIDPEYTPFDKFVAWSVVVWTMFWFVVFIIGCFVGKLFKTTDDAWAEYWKYFMAIWIIVGGITVVWFLWCGFRDLKLMFKDLAKVTEDERDDGAVDENPTVNLPDGVV